jgi:hypothetical protein
MRNLKEIRNLKAQANRINSKIEKEFKVFSNECEFRKEEQFGKNPWFKCCHKNYHLSEYNSITPCRLEHCPILK